MKPPQVTDAEVHHALSVLRKYPNGLTRADLERVFGSDRRGRDIMAALNERAIAAVINVDSTLYGQRVYRLARDIDEVEAASANLRAYELSLRRRREGLERAFLNGGGAPQPDLFGGAL